MAETHSPPEGGTPDPNRFVNVSMYLITASYLSCKIQAVFSPFGPSMALHVQSERAIATRHKLCFEDDFMLKASH